MTANPFDISFGKKPAESVSRFTQTNEILDTFRADPIRQQIYMITGIRGSGKTVLMNTIANTLEAENDWIVIRLNPDRDLLQSMGAKLCSNPYCADLFSRAKLNLSLFGLGLEIDGAPPITDIEAAIERMLKALKKQNKRVLVAIDEVTKTPHIKVFCSAFQLLIGQELPLFLLMTGLHENIYALQNEKNLTFLYRAPKIFLAPLSASGIADRYASVFSIPREEAIRLAGMTKGYPFAFQALGYSLWNHRDDEAAFLADYRQLLDEYVYEKIWFELSAKDKTIARGIAACPDGKISSIVSTLGLKQDEINQYRKRLIQKGLVDGSEYGHLYFTLPLFDVFVREQAGS